MMKKIIASLLIVNIHLCIAAAESHGGTLSPESLRGVIIFIVSLAYYIIFNGQYFHTLIVHNCFTIKNKRGTVKTD